jgi:hypothetical protein
VLLSFLSAFLGVYGPVVFGLPLILGSLSALLGGLELGFQNAWGRQTFGQQRNLGLGGLETGQKRLGVFP